MDREQIPDSVLMYACVFTYEKSRVRTDINNYSVNYSAVQNYESKYTGTMFAPHRTHPF